MPQKYHRYFPCKCFADLLDKGKTRCLCAPDIVTLEELDGKAVEQVRKHYRCKYVVHRAETWCTRCWDYGCDKESAHRQPAVIEVHLDEPPKAPSTSTAQTPKAKKSSRTTKAPKTTKSAATPGAGGRDPNPIVRSRFNQDSPLTFSSLENTPRHGGGGFTPINSPSSRGGFTPVNSPSPNSQPARRKTAIRSTPQEAVTPEPTTASAGGSAVISSRGGTQPEHGYSLRRNRPRPTDPPAGKN